MAAGDDLTVAHTPAPAAPAYPGADAAEAADVEALARRFLAAQAGKPITIRQISGRVWHGAPGTSPDAVRVHVGSLRRKIEPDSARPRYVVTEPWVGYRFVAEPLPDSK